MVGISAIRKRKYTVICAYRYLAGFRWWDDRMVENPFSWQKWLKRTSLSNHAYTLNESCLSKHRLYTSMVFHFFVLCVCVYAKERFSFHNFFFASCLEPCARCYCLRFVFSFIIFANMYLFVEWKIWLAWGNVLKHRKHLMIMQNDYIFDEEQDIIDIIEDMLSTKCVFILTPVMWQEKKFINETQRNKSSLLWVEWTHKKNWR